MTVIVKEVYDAFIDAGVGEEMAQRASNALIEQRTEFEDIRRDVHLLKWMAGFTLAFCMANFFMFFKLLS